MKRYSKTIAQQCKYYEVEDIFEYMVETYINGNHSTFTRGNLHQRQPQHLYPVVQGTGEGHTQAVHRILVVGSQSPIPCGNTESNHLKTDYSPINI